ncbi:hypothetical protein RDWZM_000305 [Blomia tropicalis]|uniref:Enolase-phosphatase E1 n=1 Tax=Blomia tropicalis TaxID=40697 RepID=A0A9Q0M9M1_BLOTA|nr:hypothetical protein RDWZM_000305 [Blomia tropicalis]
MVLLQVRKPHAILFDMSGTVTKSSFIDKVLMPYIREYCRTYFEENFDKKAAQIDINGLRSEASQDGDAPKIPADSAGMTNIINGTVAYVTHCLDMHKENKAINLLRFHMWFDGFRRERLETPVYSDVAIQIQKWRTEDNIKLFVFSNGWAEATKRFLSRTTHGDLNLLIDGHFDTSLGSLNDANTFTQVLKKINEPAQEVLFLTKNADEGRAANQAGLIVVLVLTHRRNIDKLDSIAKRMPRVRSFNEIEFVVE